MTIQYTSKFGFKSNAQGRLQSTLTKYSPTASNPISVMTLGLETFGQTMNEEDRLSIVEFLEDKVKSGAMLKVKDDSNSYYNK